MADGLTQDLKTNLLGRLQAHQAEGAADPFTNPFLLFALDLTQGLDRGEIALEDIVGLVQQLSTEAFVARAARLGAYLGAFIGQS